MHPNGLDLLLLVIAVVLLIWLIRRLRRTSERFPVCYGDYPFTDGQTAAERDCASCSRAYGCHEDSHFIHPYAGKN